MKKVAIAGMFLLLIVVLIFYFAPVWTGNASLQLGSETEGQDVLIYGVVNLEDGENIPINSEVKIFYANQEVFSELLRRVVIMPYPIFKKDFNLLGSSLQGNGLVYTQPLQIAMPIYNVPDPFQLQGGYQSLNPGESVYPDDDQAIIVPDDVELEVGEPIMINPNLFHIEISYNGEVLLTQDLNVNIVSGGSGYAKVSIDSPLQQFGTTVVKTDSFTRVVEDSSGVALAYITPVSLIGGEDGPEFGEISQDLVVGLGEPVPFSVPFTTRAIPQETLKVYLLPQSSDVRVYSVEPVEYSLYSVTSDRALSNILDFFRVPREVVRNELALYDLKENSLYRISFTIPPARFEKRLTEGGIDIVVNADYSHRVRIEQDLLGHESAEILNQGNPLVGEYFDRDEDGVSDSIVFDAFLQPGENVFNVKFLDKEESREDSCEHVCTDFGQCLASEEVVEGFDHALETKGFAVRTCADCYGNSFDEKVECLVPGKEVFIESNLAGEVKQLVLRDSNLNKIVTIKSLPSTGDGRRIDILFQ